MIGSMHVLDVLRQRGYVPQNNADAGEGWFDLAGPSGTVRAILTPEDGCEIYLFTGPFICEWTVRFANAPGAVFLATLDAAEREAQGAGSCQFCGVSIEQDDTGLWHAAGVAGADAARYCEAAPGHLHGREV